MVWEISKVYDIWLQSNRIQKFEFVLWQKLNFFLFSRGKLKQDMENIQIQVGFLNIQTNTLIDLLTK